MKPGLRILEKGEKSLNDYCLVSESPSEKDSINIFKQICNKGRGGGEGDFCCSGENMYRMRTGFDKIKIINILVEWGGVGEDSGV